MAISDRTKRLLWSRSGGYCQNPACNRDFFVIFQNGEVMSLEELAHVIGQSTRGPRGISDLGARERDEYENIILLCPTCHSLIDKSPDQFSVEILHDWKRHHEDAIRHLFVVPVYDTRNALATAVHQRIRKSRAIFRQYGPHSDHSADLLSDAADVWRRHILADVIPNNRRIANLLSANEHHLSEEEKELLETFVLHQQAFEYNHVSGDKTAAAPLFPDEMNTILQEQPDA